MITKKICQIIASFQKEKQKEVRNQRRKNIDQLEIRNLQENKFDVESIEKFRNVQLLR
ncbi:unnamed protein product [Paramecium sonneborni]|uniref:Uncharacterized protein n=1 Tax=Paramecium sonneborni TaxID=65129 RepID=A0A8S1LE44_9CILI|nr:unnamed protein product [Paramecium sonneborni]